MGEKHTDFRKEKFQLLFDVFLKRNKLKQLENNKNQLNRMVWGHFCTSKHWVIKKSSKTTKVVLLFLELFKPINSPLKEWKIDESLGEDQKNKTNGFDRRNFGNNTSRIVVAKKLEERKYAR